MRHWAVGRFRRRILARAFQRDDGVGLDLAATHLEAGIADDAAVRRVEIAPADADVGAGRVFHLLELEPGCRRPCLEGLLDERLVGRAQVAAERRAVGAPAVGHAPPYRLPPPLRPL